MGKGVKFFDELKRRNVFRVGMAYAVVGWLMIQIGGEIFPTFGAPDWVAKAYILLIALGLPVALLLAWAFEMTPEGVKKTDDVDEDTSITPRTGQRLNYVIVGSLVLALGFIAWDKLGSGSGPASVGPAMERDLIIAVLPFVNMSSDPEQEYFSDGISEEILNVLARTDGLQVVARTSSFQYKGTNQDITKIATALNANVVLEGSVRRGGDQVRITAQLIDASTGLHLWSNTYDRELNDIFAVQDEISRNIATSLLGAVGVAALPQNRFSGTDDITAYNTYLRANALKSTRHRVDLAEAVRLYEQVVTRSPNFADAWGGLAKARNLVKGNFSEPIDFDSVNHAASRALAIDPENGQALAALGLVHMNRLRLDEARQLLERAIIAAPTDPDAHFWLGMVLYDSMEIDAGMEQLEIAMRMDPANSSLFWQLVTNYGRIGKFDQAYALLDRVERGETPLSPATAIFIRPYVLFSEGREEEALALGREAAAAEIGWGSYTFFYTLAARSGDPARIDDAGELLERRMAEGKNVFLFGALEWLELGNTEKARDALIRVLDDGLDLTDVRNNVASAAVGVPGFYQKDPRPLMATIPFIVDAYAHAGIPAFEDVEPLEIGADGE